MRVLQTFICEGGHGPPQLAVLRRLVQAGHEVRALSHGKARQRVEERGARFVPFRETLPGMDSSRPESDPVRDWEARSAIGKAIRFRDAVRQSTAANALEVHRLLEAWATEGWLPDVVVLDVLLPGAAAAAQRAGIPAVALCYFPYPFPAPAVPPFGTGVRPGRGPLARGRDAVLRELMVRFHRPSLATLNEARAELGLAPLTTYAQGVLDCEAMLVMTAPELDFTSRAQLPPNVRYTGPAFEPVSEEWTPPWPPENSDPLVLISFSTTFMDQGDLAARALEAVSALPVRALLTTGPALDLTGVEIPDNTRVVRFVPHAAVLPHAALTVSHAGWATLQASLAAGVPLVCVPDARDQPDNAARVVEAGAGLRLRRSASAQRIRRAIETALADPALKAGATRMARALNRSDGASAAVAEIERLAAGAT